VSGIGGDGSTKGIEPVVAGVYRNFSFSAGYTGFQTDGFRVNGDQKDQIVNAFVQAELSSATSVQAEYRHRSLEYGFLQPLFFSDLIHPNLRVSDEVETYRVGARHSFSPGSVVLVSAMYQTARGQYSDRDIDPVVVAFDRSQDTDAGSGELQHIFRSRWVDVVSGAGYFQVKGTDVISPTFALPPPPDGPGGTFTDPQSVDVGTRHGNAYVYAHLHLVEELKITAGASADILRSPSEGGNREQVNPKLGLTWSPFAGTTLRAAGFRVLKRTLIADETLEPTQVAGFNQFFDDYNGTQSWRYGVGADQRFTRALFGGVEGSRRDLVIPLGVSLQQAVDLRETRWNEYEARGYLFWTPWRWLAVRAEYSFERLVRDPAILTNGVRAANTHRVPLGLAFFHDSGLGATATATYFNQKGSFGDSAPFTDGSAQFWLFDAGLSWRLPRRSGTIGLVATNILDAKFNLYENGVSNWNSTVQPARAVFARVTLAP
jgi:hypothetical protein